MSEDEQELREMRESVRRIKGRWEKIREESVKESGMEPVFIAVRSFIDADDRDASGLPLDSYDISRALESLRIQFRVYSHDERWDVIEITSLLTSPIAAKSYEGALRRRQFP